MDYDRLCTTAKAFVDDLTEYFSTLHDRTYDKGVTEACRRAAMQRVPAVQAIARVIEGAPEPEDLLFDATTDSMHQALNAGLRLVGAVELQMELADAIAQSGPSLGASRLHSRVWDTARSLWADGYFRQAIHAAASQLDYHLQAKLDRYDISGARLAREAFTLEDPKPGRPRLRFAWLTVGSERYRSAHEGAIQLGAAATQLIRNTSAHAASHDKLSESVALEHLACLSLWARLISTASVVSAEQDG